MYYNICFSYSSMWYMPKLMKSSYTEQTPLFGILLVLDLIWFVLNFLLWLVDGLYIHDIIWIRFNQKSATKGDEKEIKEHWYIFNVQLSV